MTGLGRRDHTILACRRPSRSDRPSRSRSVTTNVSPFMNTLSASSSCAQGALDYCRLTDLKKHALDIA
jgi:hypothetical protein